MSNQLHFESMISPSARSLLLVLFKSNKTEKIEIPSIFSSFGHVHNYKSIVPNDQNPSWTDAFITEMKNNDELLKLDGKTIGSIIEKEFDGENVLVAPMIHSIDCIKDTSNDSESDVFFAVAFTVKERLEQFPEDWFKATPYMSSCKFSK